MAVSPDRPAFEAAREAWKQASARYEVMGRELDSAKARMIELGESVLETERTEEQMVSRCKFRVRGSDMCYCSEQGGECELELVPHPELDRQLLGL